MHNTYFCKMTLNEARLILKIEDNEDINDRWESELFEIKRFLLTSTPIPKVFESKMTRLKKYHEAYEVLTGIKTEQYVIGNDEVIPVFSEDLEEAFHSLHQYRIKFKGLLNSSYDINEINTIVSNWLTTEAIYVDKWKFTESLQIPEEVIQSKEPDPMDLLNAIKDWKTGAESSTFQKLHNDFSFLPYKLRIEVKRLTLLAKYYGERRI